MNLNGQYRTHRRRVTKYREAADKMELQCPLCESYSQSIVSMTDWEIGVQCNSCGNSWQKELDENNLDNKDDDETKYETN